MNIIDPISRGRRALIGWAVLTVLLLGLFVLVRTNAGRDVSDQIDDAQQRGVGDAAVIARGVEVRPEPGVLRFSRRTLETLIQAEIFDDPTVARVRLYGVDGTLLFASDQEIGPGDVRVVSDDPGVAAAVEGKLYRSTVTDDFSWSTVGGAVSSTELLQTFQPMHAVDRIGPIGVVQVDFFMDDLRGAAINDADRVLTLIAVLALLSLAATVVTLRRTTQRQEAGVDEAPSTSAEAPAAVAAPAADAKAAARTAAVAAEAASLRKTLEAAERHRAAAEERARVTQEELEAAKASAAAAEERAAALGGELEAARARHTELEETARTSRDEVEAARGGHRTELEEAVRAHQNEMEAAARAHQGELEEAARAHRAEMEEAARTHQIELEEAVRAAGAAQVASAPSAEVDELRRRLADAESRAQAAEELVASAQADAMAARRESDEARRAAAAAVAAPPPAVAAPPPATAAAPAPTADLDGDALRRLEERIAAAEARAREAEEKVDEIAAEVSPEASDLRARLAKTAARKRLGPSSGTEG